MDGICVKGLGGIAPPDPAKCRVSYCLFDNRFECFMPGDPRSQTSPKRLSGVELLVPVPCLAPGRNPALIRRFGSRFVSAARHHKFWRIAQVSGRDLYPRESGQISCNGTGSIPSSSTNWRRGVNGSTYLTLNENDLSSNLSGATIKISYVASVQRSASRAFTPVGLSSNLRRRTILQPYRPEFLPQIP